MATPLSLTEQQQQQQQDINHVHSEEQCTLSPPRPVDDEYSHASKKQKVDHPGPVSPSSSSQSLPPPPSLSAPIMQKSPSPSSPTQPHSESTLALSPESQQPTLASTVTDQIAKQDIYTATDNATTAIASPQPSLPSASPLASSPSPAPAQVPAPLSSLSPSQPMTTTNTSEPFKEEDAPSSPSSTSSSLVKPIYESHAKSLIPHSPETLEIISNEGTSPPAYSFANGTGISPIPPKPRKQKPSRTSSPSPYSFGGMNTNMTRDQIRYCGAIMRNLKKHRDATPFIHPVDYIKLKVPDYPQIIKHPIDLTTIDGKLQRGEYSDVDQFVADIRLLFNNCYKFNGPEAMVSMLCQNVESAFEKSLRQMPPSKEFASTSDGKDGSQSSLHSPQGSLSGATSFRRISEDSRPKREIHPPPSKDYPETMTKQNQGRGSMGAMAGRRPSSLVVKRRKADVQLKFCGQAIRELKKNKYRDLNYPFLQPVDAVALNIPDYHTIITHPMDISTIERNLNNGEYDSPESFESDVRLMFNNCYRYNPPALPVHKMAKELERIFDEKWKHLPDPAPPPQPLSPSPPPQPQSSSSKHRSSVITRKADSYTSSNDEDDDISEESDNDRDDRIAELERHIANISQQIASIKSTKKKTDKSKSTSKQKSSSSKSASKKPSSKDQKPAPKPRRRATPKQQQSRPRKHSVNEQLPEFTFEQKKDLSESINNLSGDRLNTVVNIIQSSMSLDGEGQEEIVLDIDALDRKTLHRLHEFVTGKSLLQQHHPSSSSHTNAKRMNKKQKNMDSERRIRALEETLKQFNANSHRGHNSSSESDSDSSSGSDSDDSGSSTD